MTHETNAAALLRSVGLLADGPAVWGRSIPAHGPGVFIVELPASASSAPIELTRVGKWIERVESLRLDGVRPVSRALAARLASFWWPSQVVLYIGASDASIPRRLAAMAKTELGDRRPNSSGHWLRTLKSPDTLRVWWAPTSATEEYEDALLTAFADGIPATEREALPDPSMILPWANLRRPTGERKVTGLTGSLLADPVEPPAPPTYVVRLADGDAEGARGEPIEPRTRRVATPVARTTATRRTTAPERLTGAATSPPPPPPVAEALTADGAARLAAELHELTAIKRPQVIARIRTAKEHGDLKENGEYHAAREEQSFLEGRVRAIEARLRIAVIVEAPAAGSRVGLGSVVTIDDEGDPVTYTIVGADESDPTAGRISSSSPVGRALVGHNIGDDVVVVTPAGERRYRILDIA